MLQAAEFNRRFFNLILMTWMIPPVFGLGFILFIRILSPEQILGILLTPLEPLYILGWLGFAVWYFPRYIRPVSRWLENRDTDAITDALNSMRNFPLKFWAVFLVYLLLAPASVIVSAEYFTDFVAQPVDWFRIHLVALIVSIIVGLPIFFLILDLFGQALGEIRLTRPHVTIKTKVFLIGALVPLLIDTMLVQYYWTRTDYFTFETFVVWLVLELLAIAGSLIFVHSISQSLSPLQSMIKSNPSATGVHLTTLLPMSTDELGVLTTGYRQLLREQHIHNDILALNNRLLRCAGETAKLPELLDTIVSLCQDAIGGDRVFLLLEDTHTNELLCVSQTGSAYNPDGHFRLSMQDVSLPTRVYQEGETVAVNDLSQKPGSSLHIRELDKAGSALAAPLMYDGSTSGVLIAVNQEAPHQYSERELALMEGLTREAALVIKTARLNQLRREAERERAERDEHYRRLIDSTTAIPWELSLDTWRFTHIGPQAVKILGYPVEAWYEEDFWPDHIHPDDMSEAVRFCKAAAGRCEDHEFEYRMIAADGRTVWIRDDVKVVIENGQPTHLHGFMFDITQRKQAETNLRDSEARLADAQRIAHIGSWELDIPSGKLLWSDEIYRIFEIEPSSGEACYDTSLNAIHPDDREVVDRAYADALENKTPYDIEHRLLMPDGRIKFVHEHCESLYSKTGEPLRSLGTVQDISDRVRTEQELRRHREELEQLVEERTAELSAVNKELESFSYSVSHDLRAPLRAIDGFSKALSEDYSKVLDEAGIDFIARIRNNTSRMTELIDDLLSLSKLGRMKMKIEAVDLAGIATEIIKEFRTAEPDRVVEFNIQLDGPVQGDARLLRIVLENLLGNAWKYSQKKEHSEITLGMTKSNAETSYFVKDNGAGFDMGYTDKLFGAFQRLHQENEFEGTGIGLATVARIIHRHGGRVWAESAIDQGAIFHFTLGGSHPHPI